MNWKDFFNMGGYAFYVWGSYLTMLILIGGEVLAVSLRKQKLATRQFSRTGTARTETNEEAS